MEDQYVIRMPRKTVELCRQWLKIHASKRESDMGMSNKVLTGKATPKGKPQAPSKGPGQTAKITTPRNKGGKGGC